MLLQRSQALEIRTDSRVLVGATLGAAINVVSVFVYTFSVFFEAMRADLGWSLKQLSLVYAAFVITSAVLVPVAGAILDRFGSRRPVGFSFAAMVLCFVLLGALPALLPLYLTLHVLLASLGSAAAVVAFSRVISTRFDRARGLAMGIVMAGPGILAAAAPAILGAVVQHLGWRAGYFALALVVALLGGVSLSLIGSKAGAKALTRLRFVDEVATYRGLLRRHEFWLLLAAFVVAALFGGGYLAHFIPLLRSKGFDLSTAGNIASILGTGILLGRLASGWLMDRISAAQVGAGTMVLFSIGLVLLLEADARVMIIAAFLLGLSTGSEMDVSAYLVSRYFLVKDFGKTYGLLFGLACGAGAFSPLLITSLASGTTGYSRALVVCSVAMLIAGALLLFSAHSAKAWAHSEREIIRHDPFNDTA